MAKKRGNNEGSISHRKEVVGRPATRSTRWKGRSARFCMENAGRGVGKAHESPQFCVYFGS
jgi:hypothetical protein